MKLTCTCGHPNLLHFAGTDRCRAVLKTFPNKHGVIKVSESLRCPCERFVPALETDRKDLV